MTVSESLTDETSPEARAHPGATLRPRTLEARPGTVGLGRRCEGIVTSPRPS